MTTYSELLELLEDLGDLGPVLRSVKVTPSEILAQRGLLHVVHWPSGSPGDHADLTAVFDRIKTPLPTMASFLPDGERLLGWEAPPGGAVRLKLYAKWTALGTDGKESVHYRALKWTPGVFTPARVVDYLQLVRSTPGDYLESCVSHLPPGHRPTAAVALRPLLDDALTGDEPALFYLEVRDDLRRSFDLHIGGLRRHVTELAPAMDPWLSRIHTGCSLATLEALCDDGTVSRLVAGTEAGEPFLTLYLLPSGEAP